MVLLTNIQEGDELLLYLLQLCGILLIGIFQMLERTTGIHVVAGIDTYLLTILGGHIGHMSRKVNVGHQGCLIAVSLQAC